MSIDFDDETPTKVFRQYYFPEELWSDEMGQANLLAMASAELQRMVEERGGVQTVGEMNVRTYGRDDVMPGAEYVFGNEPIMAGGVMVIAEWRLASLP